MPPVFCFIDDSAFELDVFQRCIVPAATHVEFVLGSTYDQVRTVLKERYPAAFILDLYGRDPELPASSLPTRRELETEIAQIPSLDQVYQNLNDFAGDKVNEYLKRLFHVADAWRQLFSRVFQKAGQNIRYGLGNLARVRQEYPAAAAVAYTRKSMIYDAVEALAHGVEGLSLKPDGPTDEDIYRVTTLAAPALIQQWSSLAFRRAAGYLSRMKLALYEAGLMEEAQRLAPGGQLSDEARRVIGSRGLRFLESAASAWMRSALEQTAPESL